MLIAKELINKAIQHFPRWMDIRKRYLLENERYLKLYNIKKDDLNNYDLVIDTTNSSAEEVANEIIKEYEKWLEK